MKIFYVALILFALMIGGIIGNCCFIRNVTEEMAGRIQDISSLEDAAPAVLALAADWQKHKFAMGISVSSEVIRQMEECLTDMESAVTAADQGNFQQARNRALLTLEEIRRSESFSAENVL